MSTKILTLTVNKVTFPPNCTFFQNCTLPSTFVYLTSGSTSPTVQLLTYSTFYNKELLFRVTDKFVISFVQYDCSINRIYKIYTFTIGNNITNLQVNLTINTNTFDVGLIIPTTGQQLMPETNPQLNNVVNSFFIQQIIPPPSNGQTLATTNQPSNEQMLYTNNQSSNGQMVSINKQTMLTNNQPSSITRQFYNSSPTGNQGPSNNNNDITKAENILNQLVNISNSQLSRSDKIRAFNNAFNSQGFDRVIFEQNPSWYHINLRSKANTIGLDFLYNNNTGSGFVFKTIYENPSTAIVPQLTNINENDSVYLNTDTNTKIINKRNQTLLGNNYLDYIDQDF